MIDGDDAQIPGDSREKPRPPEFDVFLSFNYSADRKPVTELERELRKAGFKVWSAEAPEVGGNLQAHLASALAETRFAAFCIGRTGLSEWQLREVEAAAARSAADPDFRFAAVLLPDVPADFPFSALPVQLAERAYVDLRSDISDVRPLISMLAPAPERVSVKGMPPATSSVEAAAANFSGEVTSAAFVSALLKLHPEYGERRGGSVELDAKAGERATAAAWVNRVRSLLNTDAVTTLHGRLLIVGLARADDQLQEQLERGGFLAAVEREIREPLGALFSATPMPPEETLPTYTDNPAIIDELSREGFARILARRIRDTRAQEQRFAERFKDKEYPGGRSFLVHVNGPWGIGKTSLLNFLREDLHKPDPNPWVVVTFNAWQHQRLAPPWWWLMTSLYQHGYHELWRISRRHALLFRGREWLWRLKGGWPGVVTVIALAALVMVTVRAGFLDTLGNGEIFSGATFKAVVVGTAAVLTPILTIWGVIRSASRWLLTTSARGARIYLDHARDPMQTVEDHFRQLVEWISPHPLAIMIDDLDRCRPAFAVELLEGIQTLFRDVPAAYVVAADREWLARSYATEYSSFEGALDEPGRSLGYLFLEKTFQLTLPVPVLSEETRDAYWRRLIRPTHLDDREVLDEARKDAAGVFAPLTTEEAVRTELSRNPGATPVEQRARLEAAAIQLGSDKLERAAEHVLHPFRPLLDANPRAMKRLVNAYGLARGIELLNRHTLGGDKPAQHRTALWTILSLRWPRLADYLAAHPDAADTFRQGGSAPKDVPADFVDLFADPTVQNVVLGRTDGVYAKLDPDSIRLSVSA